MGNRLGKTSIIKNLTNWINGDKLESYWTNGTKPKIKILKIIKSIKQKNLLQNIVFHPTERMQIIYL